MAWTNSSSTDTVSVLLAGPQDRVDIWYQTLSGAGRFRISSVAYTGDDFLAKLGGAQDVILLDAACFDGPQALMAAIPRVEAATYVFLPRDVTQTELDQAIQKLERFPQVKKTFVGDTNLPELMREIFALGKSNRSTETGAAWAGNRRPSGVSPVSPHVIAVWNQVGGVGKTTITSNLGHLAMERGYKTLLIGLDGPDNLPLYVDPKLKSRPNLTTWQSNPTTEGLQASIQKVSQNLHVIAGFPDSIMQTEFMETDEAHPASLSKLVETAIKEEYTVIILDAPPSQGAASALAAANSLVLVARTDSAYRTMVAYRTATERLSGLNSIRPGKVRVVLNKVRRGYGKSPDEFHSEVSRALENGTFPPLVAVIPDLPKVLSLQAERVLPVQRDDVFREAIMPLANSFFVDKGTAAGNGQYREERKIFGIKVR
ncbi:MAG: AAA family ATPase, partial [Chloroflexota bacterium]|nr:AAA family ATPase [Chloroflexota bacterium]